MTVGWSRTEYGRWISGEVQLVGTYQKSGK